jgi:hypothetical protein
MPLDSSLISGPFAKGFNTPFENLKTMREMGESQAREDYNRARATEEQRKTTSAVQLQEVWAQFGNDVPEALKRSYAIDAKAAAEIEREYSQARSNWALEHERSIANEVAETDRSASLLAAAKGDPELFAVIVPYLAKRDKDFAAIAPTLQGADDPAIDKLLESRDTVKNIMDRRAAANKLFMEGDLYRGAAGQLATATTPEERAEMLQGLAPHLGKAQAAALAAMTPEQLEAASLTTDQRADNAATTRGQDLSAETARRGQDVSAQTQIRGQNISAETARRGQNMTDARAKADATGGGAGSKDQTQLIEAVMANPAIYADLTPSVKAAIAGELNKRGFKFSAAAATKGGPNVTAIMGEIGALSKKINTGGSGPLTTVGGWMRKGAAGANLDNDVAEYEALIQGMIPMVARANGHTGVLTQQDVDSTRNLFPQVGDNKTLAENKLARVNRLIAGGAAAPAPATAEPQTPNATPIGGRAGVEVEAPNGKVYTFESQAQADAFKKRAGIP